MKKVSICILIILFIAKNEIYSQIQLVVTIKQPSCIKAIGNNYQQISDGSISVIASNGVPPYTFLLVSNYLQYSSGSYNVSQNNGYFPGLLDGVYILNVFDAIGQSTINDSIHIISKYHWPSLYQRETIAPTTCISNDGSIILSDTLGTPPYLYSIDGGNSFSSINTFTNLTPGNYYLLSKDANGCYSDNENFSEPLGLFCYHCCNISFNAGPNYFLSGSTSCQSEGNAGAGPALKIASDFLSSFTDSAFEYSNDGIHYHKPNYPVFNSDTIGNLPPGLYNYYVKDTIEDKVAICTYAIGKSCYPYISFVGVDASCQQSDGALTVFISNGLPPYSYTIDGINYQSSNVFTGLGAGTYSVGVKDSNGEINYSSATIYNKCPVVLATSTIADCDQNNGSIQAHGYRGTKPYQFSLDNTNYQSDSLFAGIGKGNYTVYIKDAKGFTDSAVIRVINSCLSVSAIVYNEYCNHNNGNIIATGSNGTPPYSFSIDGIRFQTDSTFSNLDSGNYVLTIKDANNITDTIHVTLLNIPPPIMNFGNDTLLCNNETLLLNPNIAGASYTWQDNSTNSTYNVTKAGKYWVRANANGCLVSDTINISYLNLSNQIFPTHDTTLCIGNSIVLDAQNPGATYLWNNNATTQTQSGTTSGKYWVQVNVSGCSASDTINLHFVTGPTITMPTDTSFCTGKQIILNAGTNAATYLWSNNARANLININQGGKYWVAATQNGCTDYDTVNVIQYPTPSVLLGNDTAICAGQTLLLSAPTSTPAYQYLWQDNSTLNNYTVTNTGLYSVKVTNQYNCSANDSITVQVRLLPVFSLGNDTTLCNGQSLKLNISLPNDTYLWNTGNITSSLSINSAGLYWLKVSDSGCIRTDSINVSYKPNPQVFLGKDTTLCEGQTLLLNATNNNASYQWQDGSVQPIYTVTNQGTYSVKVTANECDTTGNITVDCITPPVINLGKDTTFCSSDNLILNAAYPNSTYLWQDGSTQPEYNVIHAGTYKVQVTNNCGNTIDSINIQYQNCACEFYIPSAFTPNGDRKNDIFKPSYKCFFTNYLFRIFNRWGQIIFTTQNPGEGWDGTLNGLYQPIGTYIWELTYYDTLLKQNITKKGTVVLIR